MTLSDARKRKFSDILKVYFLIDMIIERGQKIIDEDDEEESVDLSDMLPLEGDEEVKEGTGLKIKPLTILPVLLSQIKAEKNSHKLKNEIRQKIYLLYQHNEIIKKFTTI